MVRSHVRQLGLTAGLLLLLAGPLTAGPIFVPGVLEGDKFTPAPGVPCHCYHIRYSTTNIEATDSTARVEVSETIEGPEKAVSTVCIIPLPEGSDATGIQVTLGTRLQGDATFLDNKKAQAVYESIARGTGVTKIMAYQGRPAILVPRVELQGKVLMTLSFNTPVRHTQGVNGLLCPMPSAAWTATPVERLTLNVHLKSKEPLRSVFSPTHAVAVTRKNPTEATATVKADRWSGLDDFRLFWVADTDILGLRVLAYRGEAKEEGYFMLLGNPAGAAAGQAVEKDVILVMDTSGSMRGEKIEQARSALEYCLQHLNKGDRFNVVTFGTEVRTFRNDLSPVTTANRTAAQEFVESVVAHGQTNIAGGLEKALAGKAVEGRERIMIFVTDGAPTVGERSPEKILAQVKKFNTASTKVFVIGVGNDVNAHLLDQLAELTDGSIEYVAPREELDAKVAALYDRLSHPVLSGVKVTFGEAGVKAVLPSKLPVLFKGSEIMMVGRYKNGGKQTFTISGRLAGKEVTYTCAVDLPMEAGLVSNEFLAPLWAARQIGYLLQEIRLRGANKELVEEVVRLSKQYGIVTEYTEFIASAGPAGLGGKALYDEANKRIVMARQEQAGAWAVNQARNDLDLQNRAVAGGAANFYRDRRGQVTELRNITQIGQRAFYLQDGQWVDAEDAGKRPTRVVKLFSPEYFALLKSDPTFARAQNLGWAIAINVGNERIVVEKDGKQTDESQKVKPDPIQRQIPGPNQRQQIPGPNQEQQIPGLNRDRGLNQLENQLQLQNVPRNAPLPIRKQQP